jgi:PAS domain S-box-containing protein
MASAVSDTKRATLPSRRMNTRNPIVAFLKRYSSRIPNIAIITIIALGIGIAIWAAKQSNRRLHNDLILHTRLIADTIDQRDIQALDFSLNDRANAAFRRLSAAMKMAAKSASCLILYSMILRDGQLLFGPESIPETDRFASPPGTVYKSPPDNLKRTFTSGKAITIGPYTDEYGTFVSAFAPVIDPVTGKTILLIGMDIDATDWKWKVISDAAPALAMTLLLSLLLIMYLHARNTHLVLANREFLLKENEERYRTIFENTGNASILFKHQDETIALANRKFEILSGYSRLEIEGKMSWTVFIDPKDLPKMRRYREMRGIDPAAAPASYEFGFINRFGEKRDILLNIAVVPDTKENIASLLDLTEYKRAEEKFTKVFMTAPGGLSLTRMSDGLVIDLNSGFSEISGWDRSEVIGKTSKDIGFWIDPEQREGLMEDLRAGRDILHREFNFRHKNGSSRTGIYSARSIQMDGEAHILFVMQDITDRRRLEEDHRKLEQQLYQSQKMDAIGQLAGGVAHDFNNMLSVILGNTELALEGVAPTEPLHKALQDILHAAARSAELTRQLLAFARKQEAAPRLLDLNENVSGILKMLRRLIGEHIELDWVPGQALWQVRMDPSHVDQILANLAVNARDAIEKNGKIAIETSNTTCGEDYCSTHPECIPGDYVTLTVRDNGCGIDEEILDRIFDPFFTTKQEGQGTGLGLATVYGIVKQNNGHIDVVSESGKGTTFRIYLPRSTPDFPEVTEDKTKPKTIPRGTETILIVEDEETVLNLSKDMLEKLGYRVIAVNRTDEAIRIAAEHRQKIDLLLTDVVMPELNGKELAEQIRTIRPGIKCLYMSGYTADVIARQGILEHGVHLIMKPFSLRDLAGKVRETLGKK